MTQQTATDDVTALTDLIWTSETAEICEINQRQAHYLAEAIVNARFSRQCMLTEEQQRLLKLGEVVDKCNAAGKFHASVDNHKTIDGHYPYYAAELINWIKAQVDGEV